MSDIEHERSIQSEYCHRGEQEVIARASEKDWAGAAEVLRPLIALTASHYGVHCLLTARNAAMLAVALQQTCDPAVRIESETWAHVGMMMFLDLLTNGQGEYEGMLSPTYITALVDTLREGFPEVWAQRETFRRIGEPDFATGQLIPLQS